MTRSTKQTKLAPPAASRKNPLRFGRSKAAVVAAVVVMLSVDVPAVVLLTVTEAGDRAQVAGSLVAVGVMTHVSATAPVNPPDGVTLIVEVLLVAAPGLTAMLPLLLRAKPGTGGAVTVTELVPVALL
jgi:hypothetical protein